MVFVVFIKWHKNMRSAVAVLAIHLNCYVVGCACLSFGCWQPMTVSALAIFISKSQLLVIEQVIKVHLSSYSSQ
jgi:hypothetical protein